ncbi:Cysteine-rich repeat secretory protein 11 [Striga hermonthica]|uniref:Cysteine-rich repeat secretory protein 11 n=1 Tax=Striga hermonthica TaxID=68872 RepID=A0A9N7R7J3_STRHE|nr:Cysteine-rich repeat secretory protein 11 [Striga hermonthica]
MGNPPKPLPLLFTLLAILLRFAPHSRPEPDSTTVVYKGCSNQSFSDPSGASSQAISTVFGTLVAQSSRNKFFRTTAAAAGRDSIDGLFQCRGDLSNVDCYSCVSKLPILIDRLCGGRPVAARLHLAGCYMSYEVSGYSRVSGMEMLYKDCSEKSAGGQGFEERRDTALSALESGMSGNGVRDGFYSASAESVYVMGQCEGDVGAADCADCVRIAVQRAQVECGSSVAGRVYLDKCFVGYGYGPNGSPKKSASASFNSPYSSSYSSSSSSSSSGDGPNTGKTMAIILGGAAGVGFLVICILFARGAVKKKDDF